MKTRTPLSLLVILGIAAILLMPGNFAQSSHSAASPFDDFLVGHDAGQTISGQAGDDQIFGLSGADILNGDEGDDFMHGGPNADVMDGGDDDDYMYGASGADKMFGGENVPGKSLNYLPDGGAWKRHGFQQEVIDEQKKQKMEIQSKYSDEIMKSTTPSNTASSISQKVGKKRTPNLINLGGKSKGSSPNPTFSTGGQIEGVSSVDNSNIDLYSSSLSYGLTGAN